MKLNPIKCAFKVTVGKFLRFLVTKHAIEAILEKLWAILDMQHPISKKEYDNWPAKSLLLVGSFWSRLSATYLISKFYAGWMISPESKIIDKLLRN